MTSSRLEPPTYTTGAHRAPRRAPRSETHRPPARYEPYLDGLFTYCLSVLCDHDAATEVLGQVLAISERHYGRCPAGAEERAAWLYALARWACLRRLSESRGSRPGAHTGRREPGGGFGADAGTDARADVPPEVAERRRRELAMLAWPEAAGTTPEQREALELAVRHRLGARDIAAVLSMELLPARELLKSAACEVERTRAALAVIETGNCPAVARLTGDDQVLLSAALRRELVRHVDDCPRCRRAAERAEAAGPWPGSAASARAARSTPPGAPSWAASPAVLPLVEAPRAAAYGAMTNTPRARATTPRFGRDGFPMDPKDRAARRERLRARAVTTTVVATVVAAPVLALWAAYRGAPPTGEGRDATSVSAGDAERRGAQGADPYDYENAGNAQNPPGDPFAPGSHDPDVSVEVVSDGTGTPPGTPGTAAGRLSVTAESTGDRTRITLTATGGESVSWSAWTGASWLRLSRTSGTLAPGRSVTVHVHVDHAREPRGPWRARVGLTPTGSVVAISGYGSRPPSSSDPGPGRPTHPTRPPSSPPPGTGGPGPSDPGGEPTDPGPTDPTGPPPGTGGPTDPGTGNPTDPNEPTDPGGPDTPPTAPPTAP
ncbi:BACON domain-containing protein [Streptomyces sp. NBC_01506]|uniref:BACON domain-containing protein n=1 Tax=Streptomyces sp. NBC_01506 TaxID=2903887 RepID=UPI00386A70AC